MVTYKKVALITGITGQSESCLTEFLLKKVKPRREFLYYEDMADVCIFLLENIDFKDTYSEGTIQIKNTHIGIGTDKDISIKELALIIKEVVGYKGALCFNNTKPDGVMVKRTDPSKLHSLGWKHKVDLEDGIKIVYEWYKENNAH